MKKKIETAKLATLYDFLGAAKNTKMDDADKIKLWKICRKMKPTADQFDEDKKSAAEALKPQGFDEELLKAQEYERLMDERKPTADVMTATQYNEFIKTMQSYHKLVKDATKENGKKEVTIDFEPLTEEAFCKLLASNDWNLAQTTLVGDFLCEV